MSRILGIGSSAMSRLVDERRTPRRPIDHQRVEVLVESLAGLSAPVKKGPPGGGEVIHL
jgi:hypothetical protein